MTGKPRQQGFALLTVLWFLLLAGSIVAMLMLIGLRRAEHQSARIEQLRLTLAAESAVETVVADLVLNGPRSQWHQLPANGRYTIDGIALGISVTSENGKIDINRADPALVDRALRGLGVAGEARAANVAAISAQRAQRKTTGTLADMRKLLAANPTGSAGLACPERYFTVFSGLGRPSSTMMAPELARALGEPEQSAPANVTPGSALRISVKSRNGAPTAIMFVRILGQIGRSHNLIGRERWSCQT